MDINRLNEDKERYQDEFGEQIGDNRTAKQDEATADETLIPDEAAEEEMMPDDTLESHDNAFRETLTQTDQIGDEELQRAAERDYADEATETKRDQAA